MKDVNKNSTSIKNWAIDDRPREKMMQKGVQALSNAELLAILINNGNREHSALQLAQAVMDLCTQSLGTLHTLHIQDYEKIKGIGPAKAITIMAALELGKRRQQEEGIAPKTVLSHEIAANYLKAMLQHEQVEQFVCMYLDAKNCLIKVVHISSGGITSTTVDVRVIYNHALTLKAVGIIVAHNHPSGSLTPSKQDIHLTQKIKEAGKILDIKLVDHIIVSHMGTYSFAMHEQL